MCCTNSEVCADVLNETGVGCTEKKVPVRGRFLHIILSRVVTDRGLSFNVPLSTNLCTIMHYFLKTLYTTTKILK